MKLKAKCSYPDCNSNLIQGAKLAYCSKHREYSPERRYRKLKARANKRQASLDISFKQYKLLTDNSACFYCGDKAWTMGHGLDRINNKLGYSLKNVVTCCGACNALKGYLLTHKEMLFVVDFLIIMRNTKKIWHNAKDTIQKKRRNGSMGFKDVNVREEGSFTKLTSLEVGASLTGYLLQIEDSKKIEGAKNLVMKIDGKRTIVSVAGNVKYMIQDNKLAVGVNTRITREEDTSVKGKKATRFKVEQDMEDTYGTPSLNELASSAAERPSIKDKIAALKKG